MVNYDKPVTETRYTTLLLVTDLKSQITHTPIFAAVYARKNIITYKI